jgi:hypothetical protein
MIAVIAEELLQIAPAMPKVSSPPLAPASTSSS